MPQVEEQVNYRIDGQVRINSVDQIADEPYMKVWEIDASTKYYEPNVVPMPVDGDDSRWQVEVFFWPVDDSRNLDETKESEQSSIIIDFDPRGWQFMLAGGRYETRILAYKIRA